MANNQLISSDEPDFFLEYLLRCALTAPGAATSPTAGRILARLLVVGAVEGGDELITPYLVPMPEVDATFEVRSYRPGDLVPTEVREGLRAAAALKIALRGARDSDEGIEVVSRAESGLERCVLVRDSTGDFEFRFASPETLIGDPAECAAARRSWEETLASWRSWVPAEDGNRRARRPDDVASKADDDPHEGTRSAAAGPAAPESGPDLGLSATADQGVPEATTGWWVPLPEFDEPLAPFSTPDDAAVPATGGWEDISPFAVPADGDSLADHPWAEAPVEEPAVTAAGAPMEADPAGETDPRGADPRGADPRGADPRGADPRGADPRGADPAAATDPRGADPRGADVAADAGHGAFSEPLSSAIREAIGNLVVEVDLSQVERLIRRALDDERRESVEPLARRLSARIGETLDIPTTSALVEALSLVVPRPGDLAEAVAADVGALLSETILRRRAGDPGAGVEALHVMSGIEQLQVRLDSLQDQFQKSEVLLQAMGSHLEAGDRRAAFAERVSMSVDQEMQRLASRIDEQVTSLTANAGSGSELADGVARLTRKLRQSVAQLDRALVRLDEVIDQAGDAPVVPQRLTLARGDEPASPTGLRHPLGPGQSGAASLRSAPRTPR
jgi:hypothetical protein